MKYLLVLAGCVLVLHAWAALCYLCFRYGRTETAERQRRFLEKYFFFFTFRPFKQARTEVTQQTMRVSGREGWSAAVMPWGLLVHDASIVNVLLSITVLYFGGVMFAYSWYGQRCLRMLGLEVYQKAAA